MLERVKQIRKSLNLNQTDFGKKIGLGQQSIANIENGKIKLTDRNFDIICSTFNVNPEWLRHGTGEMFLTEKKDDALERLKIEYGLNDNDMALVKSFLELPPEYRQGVIEWGRNFLKNTAASLGVTINLPEEMPPDDKLTRKQAHEMLDDQLDRAEKKKMFSASTSTNGQEEKNKISS